MEKVRKQIEFLEKNMNKMAIAIIEDFDLIRKRIEELEKAVFKKFGVRIKKDKRRLKCRQAQKHG